VTGGSGGGNFILEKIFTSPDLKLPGYYSHVQRDLHEQPPSSRIPVYKPKSISIWQFFKVTSHSMIRKEFTEEKE